MTARRGWVGLGHWLPAALMVVLAALSPRDAAGRGMTPAERTTLDRLCRTTGGSPPSAAALAIAATATREHETFGGHLIGRGGAMVRFGAVEADVIRDEAAGRGVPWREVMRYWQSLGPLTEGPLQLRRIPRLQDDAQTAGMGDLVPLGELLARLRGGSLTEAEREALIQAAMRGAAVDIPWSAAFVSHVVLTAGVPRTRFAAAMAHLDYVSEAARRSRDEVQGLTAGAFYRACDPKMTPLRPGDLICLHRHDSASLEGGSGFDSLVPALARGERPVWNLHCDIVSALDARRRTTAVIGGNVLQSVARRDLVVDRRGALAAPRRPRPCPDGARIGPLCQPEAAPWFVVLQAVDPAEP